jgi:tetratricopeptide (TPR) repeat protein
MENQEAGLVETAVTAERSGDFSHALDIWQQLVSTAHRPDYLCKLGRVAQKLGRWTYAEQTFLDAIKVVSKLKAAPSTTESPELADKTLSLAMGLLGSLFLARTDGDRPANTQRAKEWLEQAVAVTPNQAWLSYLGSAHVRLGEKEAAKTAFRKVIELDESYAEAYFNLGLLLADDGQDVEAEKLLRRATQLDPNSSPAHGRLGILLHKQGRYSEAESEFRRAVEINPTDETARFYLNQELGSAAAGEGLRS